MELSFGQRIDPETNLVESWFTHGALDSIKEMDLSDKVVWMWGAGMGDAWLSRRCKKLYIVERVQEWIYKNIELLAANGVTNVEYIHRPCDDCSGHDAMYCDIPEGIDADVIIVDDAYRYECIVKAIEYSKTRFQGIILIVDNWQQDYVFLCPAAEELLKDVQKKIYLQADHTDHSGKPWQTLIAYL